MNVTDDRAKSAFGNEQDKRTYRKAVQGKEKFLKKFGDDSGATYHLASTDVPVIGDALGVRNLVMGSDSEALDLAADAAGAPRPVATPRTVEGADGAPVIVGNIRMGFGHYRISMAMASAAHAMGYTPYWLDLASFDETTGSKVIAYQNDLYSLGSRLSQKVGLFNRLYWEPLNSEGFRKLSYNAGDQKNAELCVPLFADLPRDVPYVGTHVWPAQAAVHAGLTHVVNAIPDNWPMALHLSEGSLHTIQTWSSYLGYKALRGMDKTRSLRPMPEGDIVYTGHYIDHELVSNLEHDTALRLERVKGGKAIRYLLTVGGAGAQQALFADIIKSLLPEIRAKKAVLFINVGDHKNVWKSLKSAVPELKAAKLFEDDYPAARDYAISAVDGEAEGLVGFCHKDIFAAVYITNLLMRASDVLVTKPSELAFYPIPKLFIQHVGGHEIWGAIHSAEMGDGTYEVAPGRETQDMLRLLQTEPEILTHMNECILKNKESGLYNGAYEVIRLAAAR